MYDVFFQNIYSLRNYVHLNSAVAQNHTLFEVTGVVAVFERLPPVSYTHLDVYKRQC